MKLSKCVFIYIFVIKHFNVTEEETFRGNIYPSKKMKTADTSEHNTSKIRYFNLKIKHYYDIHHSSNNSPNSKPSTLILFYSLHTVKLYL